MGADAWKLYGRALADYRRGVRGKRLRVHCTLGAPEDLPVEIWFRGPEQYLQLDIAALALARGRVLDVGAGVGVHSLALQQRGHAVVALDHSPEAVAIARERGVRDVRLSDIWSFDRDDTEHGAFDTVLALANGAGLARTLDGLGSFLAHLAGFLAPNGRLLVDSTDLRSIAGARVGPRYEGELEFWLEYDGEIGPRFAQLYVDATTLASHAADVGLTTRVLAHFENGSYLAELSRSFKAVGASSSSSA
ncbi:MAG: class I SAM-dependent methyltransferase [Planctomycetes bacterium]|jgi:SAM-dependent methyltransferase|nr:class I SAM-dependent methyltransferase [Planctomycetota bacterium]